MFAGKQRYMVFLEVNNQNGLQYSFSFLRDCLVENPAVELGRLRIPSFLLSPRHCEFTLTQASTQFMFDCHKDDHTAFIHGVLQAATPIPQCRGIQINLTGVNSRFRTQYNTSTASTSPLPILTTQQLAQEVSKVLFSCSTPLLW